MTKSRLVVFLLLILIFPQAQAETLSGRVVRVTDGDTIVVLDSSKVQHKIRLTGIDAPERSQASGRSRRNTCPIWSPARSVVVDYSKYDRYGRILGKVIVKGDDVNLEQVEAGFAWHYKKYQGEQSSADRVKYSDAELKPGGINAVCDMTRIRCRPGRTDRPTVRACKAWSPLWGYPEWVQSRK